MAATEANADPTEVYAAFLQRKNGAALLTASLAGHKLPSDIANQLHAKPEMFEPALEKNPCQQRGVQSLEFQCTFNAGDGPQSLIVVPESTERVPHKKAEIEMQAVKCVENCAMLETKR